MAFSYSRVLRSVARYSTEVDNPYYVDPKKMIYDPEKYGFQYSSKLASEGYEKGQKFLNRIPKYRKIHPEILDAIQAQRFIMLYSIIGILIFVRFLVKDRNKQDRQVGYQLFKDKEFVDRYSYKTREVEYSPRITPAYPI
jgi:hypothetical protein